eukprot:TRINITY_DN3937_c0_g1_i5.p1 TRINITY_DN3937_c0_g1~~TRINITY_DN3937_c0_g1_i5.p1  ORF type:complete len:669 (-),score=109.04 TRINITY_DN3937_c0_g1_i5:153-2159(-)
MFTVCTFFILLLCFQSAVGALTITRLRLMKEAGSDFWEFIFAEPEVFIQCSSDGGKTYEMKSETISYSSDDQVWLEGPWELEEWTPELGSMLYCQAYEDDSLVDSSNVFAFLLNNFQNEFLGDNILKLEEFNEVGVVVPVTFYLRKVLSSREGSFLQGVQVEFTCPECAGKDYPIHPFFASERAFWPVQVNEECTVNQGPKGLDLLSKGLCCGVDDPNKLGDGICDFGEYDTEACEFDFGDCVEPPSSPPPPTPPLPSPSPQASPSSNLPLTISPTPEPSVELDQELEATQVFANEVELDKDLLEVPDVETLMFLVPVSELQYKNLENTSTASLLASLPESEITEVESTMIGPETDDSADVFVDLSEPPIIEGEPTTIEQSTPSLLVSSPELEITEVESTILVPETEDSGIVFVDLSEPPVIDGEPTTIEQSTPSLLVSSPELEITEVESTILVPETEDSGIVFVDLSEPPVIDGELTTIEQFQDDASDECSNVEDVLTSRPDLELFTQIMNSTGVLDDILELTGYTLLVPTEEAINTFIIQQQLPRDFLLQSQQNLQILDEIFRLHVLPAEQYQFLGVYYDYGYQSYGYSDYLYDIPEGGLLVGTLLQQQLLQIVERDAGEVEILPPNGAASAAQLISNQTVIACNATLYFIDTVLIPLFDLGIAGV